MITISIEQKLLFFINLRFRTHKESIIKLKKLLSKSSKARRHRRNLLNIQITTLAWFIEFLGFYTFLLGSFILGHTDTSVTFLLQVLTTIFNFILLPCIFLISSSQFKNIIADSNWYLVLVHRVSPQPRNELEEESEDGGQNNGVIEN